MKGSVITIGAWLAVWVALLVKCRQIERRRRRQQWLAHKQRVREYEFLTTSERVRYPLVTVQDRMGPRRRPSFYACQSIWEATLERERLDREEWKRAAQ